MGGDNDLFVDDNADPSSFSQVQTLTSVPEDGKRYVCCRLCGKVSTKKGSIRKGRIVLARRGEEWVVISVWSDSSGMPLTSPFLGPPGALDSSLKKHTTLLNRLKSSLLVGPADALIKEIDGLTLSKYLEEIVGAVVEGASKGKGDPEVAVDVGSASPSKTAL